jgi:hypothetical protein
MDFEAGIDVVVKRKNPVPVKTRTLVVEVVVTLVSELT